MSKCLHDWYGVLLMIMISTSQHIETCPEKCLCDTVVNHEIGRAVRVLCLRGNMRNVPLEFLDKNANIIIISPPENNPNFLSFSPVLIQPIPFQQLRELHIVNSNIFLIDHFPFWGIQNLKLVNLTHNNLTSIEAKDFWGLLSLTELYLDHNTIKQMPNETFRHTPSLKILTLSHNRISSLELKSFCMLANLKYLDLSYNPLKELNPEVFKDVQDLRVFKCRKCLLLQLNNEIYYYIFNLEELDIGDNQLKYLTSEEFKSLKKLKKLYLDGNRLSVIVDNMFGSNRELKALTVARNHLIFLKPAALVNLTGLLHLDISHNKIVNFHPLTFTPVAYSLRTINFSSNDLPLNEIETVLNILSEIQGVGLANLSLESIQSNIFVKNEHLISLDLSWNKLNQFPCNALFKLKFLQRLDISHNRLTTLTQEELQILIAVPEIYLAKNQWRCDCSAANMILFMSTMVLNHTIKNLRCYSPVKLRGVSFGELTFDRLHHCPIAHKDQLVIIAVFISVCVLLAFAGAGALFFTRRRAIHFYADEDKCENHDLEYSEELLTPGGSLTVEASCPVISNED